MTENYFIQRAKFFKELEQFNVKCNIYHPRQTRYGRKVYPFDESNLMFKETWTKTNNYYFRQRKIKGVPIHSEREIDFSIECVFEETFLGKMISQLKRKLK